MESSSRAYIVIGLKRARRIGKLREFRAWYRICRRCGDTPTQAVIRILEMWRIQE